MPSLVVVVIFFFCQKQNLEMGCLILLIGVWQLQMVKYGEEVLRTQVK